MKLIVLLVLFFSALSAEEIRKADLSFFKSEMRRVIEKAPADFHDMFNVEAYFERCLKGEKVSDEALKTLIKKVNEKKTFNSFFHKGAFAETLEVKFFKEQIQGDEITFTLRISDKDTGFYLLSLVTKKYDGLLQIVDCMNYSAGAYLSDLMKPVYVVALTALDQNFLERLLLKDKTLMKNFKALTESTKFLTARNPKAAVKSLDKVTGHWRDSLYVLVNYITAYSTMEDYAKVESFLKRARGLYPDLKSFDYMSLDIYIAREDYKKLLGAVKSLQKTFPKDAHLESVKAVAYLGIKEDAKYFAHYMKKAKAFEVKSKVPYHLEFEVYSGEGYEKELYLSLKAYIKRFKSAHPPIQTAKDFEFFRKSKYYKAYKKLLSRV